MKLNMSEYVTNVKYQTKSYIRELDKKCLIYK